MPSFIIFLLFCVNVTYSTLSQCACSQMLSAKDCTLQSHLNCKWDSTAKTCGAIISQEIITPQPTTATYQAYCDLQTTLCSTTKGCAMIDGKCTHFAGCSAYGKTTKEECQNISNQCISDGVQCVELGDCSTYMTSTSCQQSITGSYCFWSTPTCSEADTCDKLPNTLTTDTQCRTQLSNCTVKQGEGCQTSGTNCADQTTENSCFWNVSMTVECIWNASCLEKNCQNAPNTLKTDSECQKIQTTCTTKTGGGCRTRTDCSAYTIEAACVKSLNDEDCYWNLSTCHTKICVNAPQTMTTNQMCDAYLSGCITNGKGCVDNATCSAAVVEIACVKNVESVDCFWDSICKEKTCANAPTTYDTLELCQTFLPQCTNKSAGGCETKICSNAPIKFVSNEECNTYRNGCITKQGGGCTTLTTCDAIKIEVACIQDQSGNLCYWNAISNICTNKTCAKAPSILATYQECQTYSTKCTNSLSSNGCVDLSCSSLFTQENCLVNNCKWRNKCYLKQCSLASKSIVSYFDCQSYSAKCTLDNSGFGCMDIPPQCEGITKQGGCQVFSTLKCGWLNSRCVTQSCETAPAYITNCDSYKAGCVINNTGTGCMTQLQYCSDRKLKLNCQFDNCVWHNNQCQTKSCSTAQLTFFNTVNCSAYLSGCIGNNTGDGCITNPSSCSNLSSLNCADNNCYFDGTTCYNKICGNMKLTTHADCYSNLNTCTSDGTSCINLATNCSEYTLQQSCNFNASKQPCTWTLDNICRDFQCTDVPSPSDDNSCLSYSTKCTLLVTPTHFPNCITKLSNCSSYNPLYSCSGTLSKTYDNCIVQNGACVEPTLDCTTLQLSTFSKNSCETANQACTINSTTTKCITKKATCSLYNTNTDCTYATEGECVFGGTNCYSKTVLCSAISLLECNTVRPYCVAGTSSCLNGDCTALINISTNAECQSYDTSCHLSGTLNSCNVIQNTCNGLTQSQCTKTATANCAWVTDSSSVSSCIEITNSNSSTACTQILGVNQYICEYVSNGFCSSSSSKCIPAQSSCSSYTSLNDCVKSTAGYCIYSNSLCSEISVGTTCEQMTFGYAIPAKFCTQLNQICINATDNKSCLTKKCTDISGVAITNDTCINYLSTCTVKNDLSGCITQKTTCTEYTVSDCTLSKNDGACIVISNQCIKKTCEQKTDALSSAECENYLWSCTLSGNVDVKSCTTRKSCNSYTQSNSCLYNDQSVQCYWNSATLECVILACENIKYTTYAQCASVPGVKCNINSTSTACMQLAACSDYTTHSQCDVSKTNQTCGWNRVTSLCTATLTCETADTTTHISFDRCQSYLNYCTVYVYIDGNAIITAAGCTSLEQQCSQYLYQQQCVISATNECVWVNQQCIDIDCTTAPSSYDSNEKCQGYLSGCTVSSNGLGCVTQPSTCEQMSQLQCIPAECYWDTVNLQCITRTCDNASLDVYTSLTCSSYLSDCTISDQICQNPVCEDYIFTSDAECKTAMSSCTTDGSKCVTRGLCQQAKDINGCITQSDGQECAWFADRCILKTCSTASTTYATEAECSAYKSGCTTKLSGGCTTKLTCQVANVQAACTTDIDKKVCVWDNGVCRNKDCRDIGGTTYEQCQKSNCTLGASGKCAIIMTCAEYLIQQSCIVGTGSPCLWVNNACYPYIDCTSIQWSTHAQCKQITPYCTTNGQSCVPLTTCAKLNTNGGCVNGIDGNCIQTVTQLGSAISKCTQFTSCSDALYLTHELCQQASIRCTTDGKTGCMELQNCSAYSLEINCVLNKAGPLVILDAIISTGKCAWNAKSKSCATQVCTDLKGTTPDECYAQLSLCTSDGTNCLLKGNCNNYATKTACTTAVGFDGKCYWQDAVTEGSTAYCRLLTCDDVTGTSKLLCESKISVCTYDGTKCISKNQCSTYKSKTGCNGQGTDGICVWSEITTNSTDGNTTITKTCSLMQSCTTTDIVSCQLAYDRCYTNSSDCIAHTCATHYKQKARCTYFPNFDYTQYTYCSLSNGTCITANVTALTESDCYSVTAYQYTWNGQQCSQCSLSVTQNNSTTGYSVALILNLIYIMNI